MSRKYKWLNGAPLQSFYFVEIETVDDSKFVYFNSTIHVNKRVLLPVSYGISFTDEQILNDYHTWGTITARYGRVTQCHCYLEG